MVLLIIIPMKNGYFIGKINPTFSDTPKWKRPSNICSTATRRCQVSPTQRAGPVFFNGQDVGTCRITKSTTINIHQTSFSTIYPGWFWLNHLEKWWSSSMGWIIYPIYEMEKTLPNHQAVSVLWLVPSISFQNQDIPQDRPIFWSKRNDMEICGPTSVVQKNIIL